ncbi:uncharacterized protein LOC111867817 isoform X2 [Cryptotermes secundus]|nr:uncharacterized protein LOC111867817 isoform X2 [Cryptotermes secundus]
MCEQQLNPLFVGEVEKHPVLYNFTLPGYSKKDESEKTWDEVGKRVNMTVAQCKERWKNLRAVYTRNMKCSKSGSGAKPKKAYYLLEAMQFCLPYIKALGTPSGNLPRPPQQEENELFENNDTGSIVLPEPPLSQQELQSPPPQPLPLLSTQTAEMSQQWETLPGPSPSHHIPKKKRFVNNEAVDKAFIDYFQAKKTKTLTKTGLANQDPKSEGLKMFLLSMLPDLLKMSDEEVRHFKHSICTYLKMDSDILSHFVPPREGNHPSSL